MPMSPRLLRPRAATSTAFDPRRISDLGLWLDATDASSYTATSGQISEWRDKSGNGRHFEQTTANNRPTLFTSSGDTQTATTAAINGVQSFYFDGVNDRVDGNSAARGILRNVPGCTFFCAARFLNVGSGGGTLYWVSRATSGARSSLSAFPTASGGLYPIAARTDDGAQTGLQNGGTVSFSTNYIFRHTVDFFAATQAGFVSGASAFTGVPGGGAGNTADTDSAAVRIGALNLTAAQFYPGMIGEVLIYRRALTASEIEAVEKNYLAVKWGITVA